MNVTLRKKKSASGKISLYLDITHNGTRKREYLGMMLYGRPKNQIEKLHNEAQLNAANKIRVNREKELQENFHRVTASNSTTDFVQYFAQYEAAYEKKNKKMITAVKKHFTAFLEKRKVSSLPGRDVTPLLCTDFAEYLKSKTKFETPRDYYSVFKRVVKRAKAEKVVNVDMDAIAVRFKYDRHAIRKAILTMDEIQAMMKVKPNNPEVARAFIFCLNTGLDFATVKGVLTWGMISGGYIVFERGKTQKQNRIKLNEGAMAALGKPGKANELVFNLGTWYGCVKSLRYWAKCAGVEKKITWHSGRHTLGAMVINELKGDIRVLQGILGHSDIKTTQRYASLRNETKDSTLDSLPNIKLKG